MIESDAKYRILRNILDGYVAEGAALKRRSIYKDANTSDTTRDQAASRAFIHLFLEAKYGLHDFDDRENQITDASGDGGVDAYHIDHDRRVIVLVQSKFRATARNFNEKHITIDEISRIDADRILRGAIHDIDGVAYNGKILQLQRTIDALEDVTEYDHQIVLLANVRQEERRAISRILAPIEHEIYDFSRCYEDLVVPILRGEQTYYADFHLDIDMSNKSQGSSLTAKIQTQHGPADITVILAPTLEIARAMSRYRNSILRFNPRSYLEFSHQATNSQIRESIVGRTSGEFALLNNGITILSDATKLTDMTGKADTARVKLRNPQIINGGQTAFTLSRVYDELPAEEREAVFKDKEVVVRIISLSNIDPDKKRELIEEISSATNSQTQVITADRVVANDHQRQIATRVFLRHGALYEHKRGEYANAVHKGYVDRDAIIERTLFLRLMYLASGAFESAVQAKGMRKATGYATMDASDEAIERFGCVLAVYRCVLLFSPSKTRKISETIAQVEAAMTAMTMGLRPEADTVGPVVERVAEIWPALAAWCMTHSPKRKFFARPGANTPIDRWARTPGCQRDIRTYLETFGLNTPPPMASPIGEPALPTPHAPTMVSS